MALASLVLNHHYLKFNGTYKCQIRGTTIGSNFAVIYAWLFFIHKKNKFGYVSTYLSIRTCYTTNVISMIPLKYRPARNGSYANSWAYTIPLDIIEITYTISNTTVDILDMTFFKDNDFDRTHRLSARCHPKVQNKYQYLHWSSWNPYHQKKASFPSGS